MENTIEHSSLFGNMENTIEHLSLLGNMENDIEHLSLPENMENIIKYLMTVWKEGEQACRSAITMRYWEWINRRTTRS